MAYAQGVQYFDQPQTLSALPDGPAGVRATLRAMSNFVQQGAIDPVVRQLALSIVRSVPAKDWAAEAEAVRAWVAGNIRYVRDIRGIETVQSARATLELRQGDCDDQSVLVGALLSSIGADVQLVAIGSAPGEYQHVFCEVDIPGAGWFAVETTEPVKLGWVPNAKSRMVQGLAGAEGLGFLSVALAAVSIIKSYSKVRKAKNAIEHQKSWAQQEVYRLERLINEANSQAQKAVLQQQRLTVLAERDIAVQELSAANAALDAVVQSRDMQRVAVAAGLVGVVAIAGGIKILRKKRRRK